MLGTENRPRPGDPHPSDELRSRETVVLHGIAGDERAGSAEPRLAVHRDGARGALGDVEELDGDVRGRRGAVVEQEVVVRDARRGEGGRVVLLLVEADDGGDAKVLEDGEVGLGEAVLRRLGYRRGRRHRQGRGGRGRR